MADLSWNTLRQLVYERASGCCEYCLTSAENSGQTMQVDHIDPDGSDDLENLCLACWNCNNHKRKASTDVDPKPEKLSPCLILVLKYGQIILPGLTVGPELSGLHPLDELPLRV